MSVVSNTDALLAYEQDLPFALLRPKPCPARHGTTLIYPEDYQQVYDRVISSKYPIAIDFETRGTDPMLPDNYVVGMGIGSEAFTYYLPRIGFELEFDELLQALAAAEGPRWIAHNVYFDGQWVFHMTGRHLDWQACTYSTYRHLATENWPGQKHGLKAAMTDLLVWGDTNTAELDQWLTEHGFINQSKNIQYGEMWRAPTEILAKYCCLDVEATYLLYTEILEPTVLRFVELDAHLRRYVRLIELHIEQRMVGMPVDVTALESIAAEKREAVMEIDRQFHAHPLVAPLVAEWESLRIAEFMETEPDRYLKSKLGAEPQKYTKSGDISKNWEKWYAKSQLPPVQSKNWEKWDARRIEMEAGTLPDSRFNMQSGDHLRWMFYDKLGYKPTEFTETGLPAVSSYLLERFGEPGKLLSDRAELTKELGYIEEYIRLGIQWGGVLRPSFRLPGTHTGRPSSNKINLLQIPKTKAVMGCFPAPPGRVIVDLDFRALEPTVAAEVTGDTNLRFLYGDATRPNDVYLFYGAQMRGTIGARIRATGYDPFNPTPETIAKAKKECKFERGTVMKPVYLSDTYGSSARKKHQILKRSGVDMSISDVEELHQSLREAKSGVLAYTRYLEDQWRKNKGWIYNAIMCPVGVHKDSTKDLFNRAIQGGAHGILTWWVCIFTQDLTDAGIDWQPYIMDWYDAASVTVPESQAQETARIMEVAVEKLNDILGGEVRLGGTADIGRTLADVKQPERE